MTEERAKRKLSGILSAEVLRIQPNFSVDSLAKRLPYKDPADVERIVNAQRKAGLK